jgi:hypothetical protein
MSREHRLTFWLLWIHGSLIEVTSVLRISSLRLFCVVWRDVPWRINHTSVCLLWQWQCLAVLQLNHESQWTVDQRYNPFIARLVYKLTAHTGVVSGSRTQSRVPEYCVDSAKLVGNGTTPSGMFGSGFSNPMPRYFFGRDRTSLNLKCR